MEALRQQFQAMHLSKCQVQNDLQSLKEQYERDLARIHSQVGTLGLVWFFITHVFLVRMLYFINGNTVEPQLTFLTTLKVIDAPAGFMKEDFEEIIQLSGEHQQNLQLSKDKKNWSLLPANQRQE